MDMLGDAMEKRNPMAIGLAVVAALELYKSVRITYGDEPEQAGDPDDGSVPAAPDVDARPTLQEFGDMHAFALEAGEIIESRDAAASFVAQLMKPAREAGVFLTLSIDIDGREGLEENSEAG